MRSQRLDFAHPQPAVKLKARPYGALVLAVSMALAAGLVDHYLKLAEEIETLENRIGRLTRGNEPREAVPASREKVAEEVGRVNRAAAQLTIPWEDLFQAVESATDKHVALLALQPNFQKRELKISGEAEEFAAVLRYIERLASGGALAEVRLLRHELVSRPNSSGIRFELTATWRLRA